MSARTDRPEDRSSDPRELLTVIIPCLDEADVVASTVDEVLALAPRLPLELEILLIDDGSTDGTRAAMEELCRKDPRCRMRVNARNRGQGRSVLDSYAELEPGSWVTVLPGDNEFEFESILGFLELRDRHDLILGYFQNPVIRPFRRRLASAAFTLVANALYGFRFRYLNGMKLYRVDCFRGIEVVSSGHAFNAELLAKAVLRNPRLRIGQAPFLARGRAQGASKAFRPLAVLRALRDVVRGYRSVTAFRDQVIRGAAR
jgi:glycosyltransferase involved in cell wall biosynthesis